MLLSQPHSTPLHRKCSFPHTHTPTPNVDMTRGGFMILSHGTMTDFRTERGTASALPGWGIDFSIFPADLSIKDLLVSIDGGPSVEIESISRYCFSLSAPSLVRVLYGIAQICVGYFFFFLFLQDWNNRPHGELFSRPRFSRRGRKYGHLELRRGNRRKLPACGRRRKPLGQVGLVLGLLWLWGWPLVLQTQPRTLLHQS